MEFVFRCEMPVELVVAAELLGTEHRFRFENREVSVTLSKRFMSDLDAKPDLEAEHFARCVGWTDGRCVTVSINHLFLAVELLDSDGISLDEEMILSEEDTNRLFWEKNSQDHFRERGRNVSNIASRAFDYWCRVVRWMTGLSYVGLPLERHDTHPGWRYVASVDPLEYVASFNDTIIGTWHSGGISLDDWANIQETLHKLEQTPIWIDTYHDAKRRLETGDIRGAYLDAAVSAESFIRRKLMASLDALPEEEPAIRKRIESWNMTDILNSLNKVSTLRALELGGDEIILLRKAFVTRNSIMHGKSIDLDDATLKSILSTVKALIRA